MPQLNAAATAQAAEYVSSSTTDHSGSTCLFIITSLKLLLTQPALHSLYL